MTRLRRRARIVIALSALLLASCATSVATASFPDRDSDARGALALSSLTLPSGDGHDDTVQVFTLVVDEGKYPYYWNATLYFSDDTVVGTHMGEVLALDDLVPGLWVEVWTDACQESYPVQCGVTHVLLTVVDDLGQ